MEHLLKSGMILDSRYRIDRMLGEGGFGITYAAENIRIGLKVAIKEFFWHDHSTRNIEVSPCVSFLRAEDKDSFQIQKDRFLKEARVLRDFSNLTGIVHILDYFEENDTAYIVMEYIDGVTLSQYLAEHGGQMEPESLLRRVLPIVDSLDQIHKSGVIHRDISPDNIMVTPDGTLKIIDFGAARQIVLDNSQYTTITKGCYTPCEQYDVNGHQGPWTDIYALCATLYACICGAPPQGAIQRMFLDEVKTPSQLGVAISPAYESIIMKGLQLRPEQRWQSMDELAQAIRAALPEEKPQSVKRRGLTIALLAGLLCIAVALGIWGWRRYDADHKFRGIETESIRFEATEDTTASEFALAPDELRKRLDGFVDKDNYLLAVNGDSMLLTIPLSAFENREILDVIIEHFSKLVPEKGTNIRYEMKANWEDPSHSMIAGQNQVLPEALEGPTVIIRYDWNDSLTRGQRANLIVDFKTRLDALGVPYAFGSAYGNDDSIMIRIGMDRIGDPVLNTIGESVYQLDFTSLPYSTYDTIPGSFNDSLEITESAGAPAGLLFCAKYDSAREGLEKYTREMTKCGLDRIYLVDRKRNPIAYTSLSAPITDGTLVFQDFCLRGISSIEPEDNWLLEYFDTVVNKTKLPETCSLQGVQYVDADGAIPLDDVEINYGVAYADVDTCQAMREKLHMLEEKHGFTLKEGKDFWLFLNLPLDGTLPENIAAKLPALVADISDGQQIYQKKIYIVVSEEQEDDQQIYLRTRFVIGTSYDYAEKRFMNKISKYIWGDALESPWQESIDQWWEAFDPGLYGIEKSEY